MARELPYIQAIGEAVHQEMARDDTVSTSARTSLSRTKTRS